MSALFRYELEFLLRSRRWLPPFLAYVLTMTVGVGSGQPLGDSLGFGAAVLVPVTAWFTRGCLTAEPDAVRLCAEAAAGRVRVHLAQLLAALAAGLVTAGLGTVGVLLLGDRVAPRQLLPVVTAGVLAAVVAVLVGVGMGALCNRPLVHGSAVAVPLSLAASLGMLVVRRSPVNAAVRPLVHGGAVVPPVGALAAGLLFAGVAVGVAVVTGRRIG